MALDTPRTAEGRGRQPRGGAAAEAHGHGDLAPNPALHVQACEGVLVGVQVVGPFAFVIPAWLWSFVGFDLQPEVDRHPQTVKARTDVRDRGGALVPQFSFTTLPRAPACPALSLGRFTL